MMNTFFSFSTSLCNFFFYGWSAQTLRDLIPMFCTVGILVILLEIMKTVQVYLMKQIDANPITYAMTEENMADRPPLLRSLVIPSSLHDVRYRKIKLHCSQTIVHVLHMLLGYMIMLALMTYNAFIAVSVLISTGLGFYIFGAVRHVYFQASTSLKTLEEVNNDIGCSSESNDLDASMQSIRVTTRRHVI